MICVGVAEYELPCMNQPIKSILVALFPIDRPALRWLQAKDINCGQSLKFDTAHFIDPPCVKRKLEQINNYWLGVWGSPLCGIHGVAKGVNPKSFISSADDMQFG